MEHHFDFLSAVGIPYLNFFIFLGAFIFFFRKPLASLAKSRREEYLNASREARQVLEQATKSFTDVKTRLDGLDAELAAFKTQSEKAAQEESARIVDDSMRVAKQIREDTSRLAAEAISSARQQLREEIIEAAKTAAENKLKVDLDSETKSRVLKGRIDQARSVQLHG